MSLPSRILYHANTLFLFTRGDIRTTIIPITMFAAATAPVSSVSKLLQVIFWIWIHLLQFNLSNQTKDIEEDQQNKPDRPIPAQRISVKTAVTLRWVLVPICFALSATHSQLVLFASALMAALTILYNEFRLSAGHFIFRNLLVAFDLAAFEVGSTLIAANDASHLDSTMKSAIILSTLALSTTYHAQDFRDVHGDRLIGRKTLPIVFPSIARPSVSFGILSWTIYLCIAWELDISTTAVFSLVACIVSGRFVLFREVKEDKISFHWYNAWLSIMHILPGVWRLNEFMGRTIG